MEREGTVQFMNIGFGQHKRSRKHLSFLKSGLCLPVCLLLSSTVHAAGVLDITINAPFNLVVDSNVCSPPTYAPEVATHSAEFCNLGDAELTDVVAYVGDFANQSPAVYPQRDSTSGGILCAASPHTVRLGQLRTDPFG